MEFSRKFGKSFIHIDSEAKFALQEFDWSGNVRELKNVIERGVLLADDNESKAARLLGLSRDKFRYRRRKLNQLAN